MTLKSVKRLKFERRNGMARARKLLQICCNGLHLFRVFNPSDRPKQTIEGRTVGEMLVFFSGMIFAFLATGNFLTSAFEGKGLIQMEVRC